LFCTNHIEKKQACTTELNVLALGDDSKLLHEKYVMHKTKAECSEISPTLEQQVLQYYCDADVESLFNVGDDVVGLSLMSHEVQRDGTITNMKGQRCNIFQ
jgi:hypothetical protein